MSYSFDQNTGDIVISGFDQGIQPSPHKGIASIRNANITTEVGEVMCNFSRSQQSSNNTVITLTATSTSLLSWPNGTVPIVNQTIKITASTVSGLSTGIYWVLDVSNVGGTNFTHIASQYDEVHHGATPVTWSASSGTATTTLLGLTSQPVAGTTETYFDGSILQYRYYVAETAGYIWVLDTAINTSLWSLIDSTALAGINGLGYYNGMLHVFRAQSINFKITCILGQNPSNAGTIGYGTHGMSNYLNTSPNSYSPLHFCLTGHSGFFYTDENFVASILADSTSTANNASVFSYGSYSVGASNVMTVTDLFAGSFPVNGQTMGFFTDDSITSGFSLETVYYVISANANAGTFKVSTSPGGGAVSITAGTGNQYFNSYDAINGTVSGNAVGTGSTFIGTPQACTLPFFESATALAELNNNLVIGTRGNTLYVWDEGTGGSQDISPQSFIPMAETNCTFLLTVNNVVFDFRGQKGNIYVTSGSAASGVLTVPDYLSGTPGNPTSYIEPYFTWGQAFFQRGRVFFSIQDSNGNCGGIYSFVPSFFNSVSGQDSGLALRLENYHSYGNYAGLANVLLNSQNQNAIGVQYFSAWTSGTPTYGIDGDSGSPYTSGDTIIETDLIQIGTYIEKGNFSNVQSRYTAPLQSGESVQVKYRTDATSTWQPFGDTTTGTDNTAGSVGARWPVPWAQALQVQFQIILTAITSNSSFVRFKELRIKK